MSGDRFGPRASAVVGDFIVVTCEHGGNRIPLEYAGLFRGWHRALRSHRGYDAGALAMARDLASVLHAPLVASTVTRLLVDLNRSLSNPAAWSEATRSLPPAEKQRLVRRHYAPHHRRVAAIVGAAVASGYRVIHLASHSFTPMLDGQARTADVGLLYDPSRRGEVMLAETMEGRVRGAGPPLARAAELSLCRQGRRTHAVLAPAFFACTLRRHRDRAQSVVRAAQREAVAGPARVRRRNVANSAASPSAFSRGARMNSSPAEGAS